MAYLGYQIERDEDIGKVVIHNGTNNSMIMLIYRDVVENPQGVTAYWKLSCRRS